MQPHPAGLEFARKTLDGLGYDYIQFDDHHFNEDLQWEDAVPMFHRLMQRTGERGLEFGVKITNTFPVDVAAGELPSEEMYMSGRSSTPCPCPWRPGWGVQRQAAHLLFRRRGHSLGAGLFGAGIWPITIATHRPSSPAATSVQPDRPGAGGHLLRPLGGVDAARAAALAEGIPPTATIKSP